MTAFDKFKNNNRIARMACMRAIYLSMKLSNGGVLWNKSIL